MYPALVVDPPVTALRSPFPCGDGASYGALPPAPTARLSGAPSTDITRNWWYYLSGELLSQWNASINNIRIRVNDYLDSDEPNAASFREQLGSCYDLWISYEGSGCVYNTQVSDIVDVYSNLVNAKTFPPYYFVNYPTTADRDRLVRAVANASSQDFNRVKLVLGAMHDLWAGSPSKVTVAMIDPPAWTATRELRATPEQADTVSNWFADAYKSVGGAIEDVVSTLQWVLVAAGIVGAAYVGYMLSRATNP